MRVSFDDATLLAMNALGDLLRARKETLLGRGDTVRAIAARAGLPESTVYEHLARREPNKSLPLPETLERLAKGFKLKLSEVVDAARNSVGPLSGDPLQLLIRSRQLELGRSAAQAVRLARSEGLRISEGTVSAILGGTHTNITDPTCEALAVGFELDVNAVRQAAEQSRNRVTYRLPAHLEDQLTPERWAKIVKIVEGILTVE